VEEHEYDPNWVQLNRYKTSWRDDFNLEKTVLLRDLGDAVLDIQHVGSTSIPGLSAKPIIDIIVGVSDLDAFDIQNVGKLENAEYSYRGDAGVPGRIFFRKGKPRAKFHLSIATINGDYWNKQIVFRDYLRTHPQDAKEYEELKVQLARQYPNDRAVYTSLKNPLITSILEKANSWQKDTSSDF